MSQITLSDGRSIDTTDIEHVTFFPNDGLRILIELKNGGILRLFGPGVEADAMLLKEVREREKSKPTVFSERRFRR
ncbi:MAG: hypothetical protein ACR2JB_25020 [Bryobacteraceae bacterium]